MSTRVFVDGQEGTTGLRIDEFLAKRSDVEVLRIDPEKRKDAAERARLLNAADVAFLCLPDAASREAVAMVTNSNTCLIDASTAHRTAPGWVFGMPELSPKQRVAIRSSKRISNPGCHATGFILLMRPLVDTGLVPATTVVMATSITGYSGGGKSMIQDYQEADAVPPAMLAPRPYALSLQHKHVPEMMMHTGLAAAPIFMPIVGPFYKGMTVTVPLDLTTLGCTAATLHAALEARYAGERFAQVMPLRNAATLQAGFFDVQGSNDTNRVDIFVFASDTQALLMARLDNLGKGASGAAVQSMNVHLGVEESLGL